MALYSDILRQKRAGTRLRGQAERYRGLADSAGPFITPAGSVQGMNGYSAPTPQAINWGSILQTGLGNYMAGQAEKKADAADDTVENLREQFMRETLENDPESMKLYQMAQMGVPGSEQALSERIAPKRQPLATFTQFVAQNPDLDDESAAAMGAESGISRELSIGIVNAARQGRLRSETSEIDKENRSFGRTLLRDENLAALKDKGKKAEDEVFDLTPGQKHIQGNMMKEADSQLSEIAKSSGKFQTVMDTIKRDNAFGFGSKAAEVAAGYEGFGSSIINPIGKSQLSEGAMMLKEYVTGETLRRMAQLGGNDSNYELNVIAGSLPSVLHNKEAAIAMLERLHEWEETTRLAIKLRRDDIQTGKWFGRQPNQDDYYSMAKKMRASGQKGYPKPEIPSDLKGIPTDQSNAIESMLDGMRFDQ